MSDELDLTSGFENIDDATSTLDSTLTDSTLTDSTTVLNTDVVPDIDDGLSEDIKAKLEKYKEAVAASGKDLDPADYENYTKYLIGKEQEVPLSQFEEEVNNDPPTWAEEYPFEKQESIMEILDSKLEVEDNDYDNVDYSHEPFGPLNNVHLNDDNFEEWLTIGDKGVDEHFDELINTELGAQLGQTIADELREDGYVTSMYTEDQRKELVAQIRSQYKNKIQSVRTQKAEETSFEKLFQSEKLKLKNSQIETFGLNEATGLPSNSGLMAQQGSYNDHQDWENKNHAVAYNNLFDATVENTLATLGEQNPNFVNIYEGDLRLQELYQATVDTPNATTLAAFLEQQEALEGLRDNMGFGSFLKDASGQIIEGITEQEVDQYTEEAENQFNNLEYFYDLHHPDTQHTLKNAWLKATIHAQDLQRQVKSRQQLLASTNIFDQQAAGIDKTQIAGGLDDLKRRAYLAQAKQEALNHYYLLNHRYLSSDEALDTYKVEEFSKKFLMGFGMDPVTSAMVMDTPEYTEQAAVSILNDFGIRMTDEEEEGATMSTGEEFSGVVGDMTALIPKLMLAKGVLNPIVLGGGYLQTAAGGLATAKRLQKYPKLIKQIKKVGETGLIGSYYKKRIDASGKLLKTLTLKEKFSMVMIGGTMEEIAFKSVGGATGHGFGFGVSKFAPIKLFGGWQPKPMYQRLFKRNVLGNLGRASSATLAMEAAGITGAFWEVAKYDDTFQEKFEELFPSTSEVGKRLMFNLALNSFLGLSEAYNPTSVTNLIRSSSTYNPLTGKRGRNPFTLTADRIRKDFMTSKADILEHRNYLSNDPAWQGKGRETNKEIIELLDNDLKYAYDLEKNVENWIGRQVFLDNNSTSAGTYTNSIHDLSMGLVNNLMYKPRGWNTSSKRYLDQLNGLNKKLYGAQAVEFTQENFEHMASLKPSEMMAYYYKKQDDQTVARAKYLQKWNIIREVPFIDMETGVETPVYFRITQKRTTSSGEAGTPEYIEGQNVLNGYFVRKGADGKLYRLTKPQTKRLKQSDRDKAQEIFEAEKVNLNKQTPNFVGKGTATGGAENIIEISNNTVDQQIAHEKEKSKSVQNKRLLKGLNIAKKLINILPEGLGTKFVFHTDKQSHAKVIKTLAWEKRSNAIARFNKGRTKESGEAGYSETEFRSELIRIREAALKQTKNAFIVGAENMIHVDLSSESNIEIKDIGNVLAHELGHPFLEMIKQIDPASYKALEQLMMSSNKYAKKYRWAKENYTNSRLRDKRYIQSLSQQELVNEITNNEKLILNETMAEWLGSEIAKSELSGGIRSITRPLQSFYRNLFGGALSDLMVKGGIDPTQITVSDLSDLSSFKDKIARAIRVGNRIRFSPDIKIPVIETSGGNEQFNIIGETAIANKNKKGDKIYDDLMVAREMRRDGASALSIFNKTEYYLNNTGKLMKFAGPGYFNEGGIDRLAEVLASLDLGRQGAALKIGEILEGPYKLYYPEIANAEIRFEFDEVESRKSKGAFIEAENTIIIYLTKELVNKTAFIHLAPKILKRPSTAEELLSAKKRIKEFLAQEYTFNIERGIKDFVDLVTDGKSGRDPLSTIIHEVQHFIQSKEAGLGHGTSPSVTMEKFAGLYLDKNMAAKLAPLFIDISELRNEIEQAQKELKDSGIDTLEKFEKDKELREKQTDLLNKQTDLGKLNTWKQYKEIRFNQVFAAVARGEKTAIENLLGSGTNVVHLPKVRAKMPKSLKFIFNDLNQSIVNRYKLLAEKANSGQLSEKEKDQLKNRYETIIRLINTTESYYNSNGEIIARMAEAFSAFDKLKKEKGIDGQELSKELGRELVLKVMESDYDVPSTGLKGYLGIQLDRINKPEGETNKILPFGTKYESEGQEVTSIPAGTELFIARAKVKTPETYVEYLSKFDNKKTFITKQGGPQGSGKLYDDKTADKLKVVGEIAKAIQENNGDVIGKRKEQLDEWISEAMKFITFTAEQGERTEKHRNFLENNEGATDRDWEAEMQQWVTVLRLVDYNSEGFVKDWKTNFKAIQKIELFGKDAFKRLETEGTDFKTGTLETEENIQMVLDILEGDGGQKGRRSFLTRLFGGTAERANTNSAWSIRRLNLYGTHNIYSILDDLSINHSESETFKSPLVKFALNRLSGAENDYHENKYTVLESINTKMREIYEIEELSPDANKRQISKYQKDVTDRFRENERTNKKQHTIKYTNEQGDVVYEKETWSANEAAKLYIEAQDASNHRGLETMGIMRKMYSLKEQYKTFEEFEKNGPFKDLEIFMVGQGFEGLRTRTVEQAQNAINRINRLKLEAIQKEFDNKTISSKAKRAKEKMQASFHEKALLQIRKTAKEAYEKDVQGGYELTNKGKAIIGLTDPKLKKWADFIVNEFFPAYSHGKLYDGHVNLDQVFRGVYGFSLPKNKKYSPVMRRLDADKTAQGIDLLTPEVFYQQMTSSHFKEKQNSSMALAKQDINNMLLRFVHKMEFFKAYQKPLTDLNNVFNNEGIRDKINEDFGPEYNKYLNQNIRDLAGKDQTNSAVIELLHKVRSNYVIGSLGAKPSLTLKQLTSFVAYAADMPSMEFMKGIAKLATIGDSDKGEVMFPEWKEAYETLMDLPYMKKRYSRLQFDDALAQVMSPAEFDRVPDKAAYFKKRLVNALMSPVVLGDRTAIIIGGWPKYKYEYNKAIAEGKSEPEARSIAAAEFEASTRFAQQASESSDLSLAQRDPVMKMLTMYATSPMSYHRQARAAMRALASGKGTRRANRKKILIYHFILPQLFQGATNSFILGRKKLMGQDDDIDEDLKFDMEAFLENPSWKSYSESFGSVPKSHLRAFGVGSFNGMFMLKDAIAFIGNLFLEDLNYGLRATPVESAAEAIPRNAKQMLKYLAEFEGEIGPEDIYEALELFGKVAKPTLELGFGFPATGVGKGIEPIWEYMKQEDPGDDPSIKYVTPQPE